MSDYPPSIPLARLFERISKKGNHYLTGRLGLAKIAIVKTDETTEDGTAIWALLMSEGSSARSDQSKPADDATTSQPARPRMSSARRNWQDPRGPHRERDVTVTPIVEDAIPF